MREQKINIRKILETAALLILPGIVGYITAKQEKEEMCETVREYLETAKLLPESTNKET